jgi:hypothetical protein
VGKYLRWSAARGVPMAPEACGRVSMEDPMTGPKEPAVLLVENEEQRRTLFGGWLESVGFDVLTCPGPSAPEYSCIGTRAGRCPLVDAASLIVLGPPSSSDPAGGSTARLDVVSYCLMTGKPVIALGVEGLLAHRPEDQLIVFPRTPERRDLITAARAFMSRSDQANP